MAEGVDLSFAGLRDLIATDDGAHGLLILPPSTAEKMGIRRGSEPRGVWVLWPATEGDEFTFTYDTGD